MGVFYGPMPKFVGRFRGEKGIKLLMDLPSGGGLGSELDPRIVVWVGSVQHDVVEILFVLSP